VCPDYIIFYGSGTRRIKKYFYVLYGGGRRSYGGARCRKKQFFNSHLSIKIRLLLIAPLNYHQHHIIFKIIILFLMEYLKSDF